MFKRANAEPFAPGLDATKPIMVQPGWQESLERANKKIADAIITSGGVIISEFPIGTFAAPQNFPIRNRIISGMTAGVLVVEAGEYSGTRITARCALEQNREVFAVPGNVTNKNAWGPKETLNKQWCWCSVS